MRRAATLGLLSAALSLGLAASAAPPKKKPAKPPPAPWSPVVMRTPLDVTLTSLHAVPAPRAQERTITADLSPRTPASTRTITLRPSVGPGGWVQDAHVEILRGPELLQTMTVRLDAAEETILASLELVDLDFDGWLDLRMIRASGAKWVTYAVRLFDPKKGAFVETDVARRMSLLPNLEPHKATRRLVSTTIGPQEPSHASYRIEGGELVLERDCVFKSPLGIAAVGTLIVRERDGAEMRERRFTDAPLPEGFPERCDR